jgi:hypothetical protein
VCARLQPVMGGARAQFHRDGQLQIHVRLRRRPLLIWEGWWLDQQAVDGLKDLAAFGGSGVVRVLEAADGVTLLEQLDPASRSRPSAGAATTKMPHASSRCADHSRGRLAGRRRGLRRPRPSMDQVGWDHSSAGLKWHCLSLTGLPIEVHLRLRLRAPNDPGGEER